MLLFIQVFDETTSVEKIGEVATEVQGFCRKKNRNWFDESDVSLDGLIAKKNRTHNNYIEHPTNHNRAKWKDLQADLQRETRRLKDEWWIN